MLKTYEFRNLLAGTLELALEEVHLGREDGSDEHRISGTGILRQSSSGELNLTMFASGNMPFLQKIFEEHNRPPGELLRDDHYYRLEAVDSKGRRWTAPRVHPPNFRFSVFQGPVRLEVEASLPESQMVAASRITTDTSSVEIRYPRDIDFPFNQSIRLTEVVGERKLRESHTIGAATFSAAGYEFFAWRDEEYIRLSASSPRPFPDRFEDRVNEALELVLARRLAWTCVSREEGRSSSLRVKGTRIAAERGRMQLPVDWRSGEQDAPDAAFCLFDQCLTYLLGRRRAGRAHLLTAVRFVLHAAHSPVDAHALDLAVATETVLGIVFQDAGKASDEVRDGIKRVVEAIRSVDVSDDFIRRAEGRITSMAKPSAADRLRELENQGVVTKEEVKAWRRIRHPAAHGEVVEGVSQDYLDNFFRVMMLFYRLVFEVIGYSGPFRDYGERGWPWRRGKE